MSGTVLVRHSLGEDGTLKNTAICCKHIGQNIYLFNVPYSPREMYSLELAARDSLEVESDETLA